MHTHASTPAGTLLSRILHLVTRSFLLAALFLPLSSFAKPAYAADTPVTLTISELDQLGTLTLLTAFNLKGF